MPVTRSVASKHAAAPPNPVESKEQPPKGSEAESETTGSVPTIKPEPSTVKCKGGSVTLRSQSAKSLRSVKRAEAVARVAKSKLAEAQAATALAEAELARIDAESTEEEDVDSGAGEDKSILVKSWLATQNVVDKKGPPNNAHTEQRSVTAQRDSKEIPNMASLAAAITEAARASSSHAPLKYLYELPTFSGACSEWLAFRATYRDTSCHFTRTENLVRLRRCLRGAAKEAAISLFVAETEPEEVIRLLEVRFGRPDALVMAEMDKIKALSKLTDNPRDICIFASRVINIVAVVKALHKVHYLYNPEAVRTVVDRMTPAMRYRWYDYAAGESEDEPDLIKLSSFLSREADLCSQYAMAETQDRPPVPQKKPQRTYSTAPARSATPSPTNKPACDNEPKDCTAFASLDVNARWEKAKTLNLCFRCLKKRNYRHRCRYKACGIEECRGSHHPLLHNKQNTDKKEIPVDSAVVTSARPHKMERAFLKVIPVRVRGPTSTVETFALLDEGSTITLIEDRVAQAVGAKGPKEPFDIEGVAGARINAGSSVHVSLHITGQHADTEHHFTARTIKQLQLSPQTIDETVIDKCVHLQEIAKELMYCCGTPSVLIGQDNWNLIVSRSVKSGKTDEPVASLTELGWVLHGPNKGKSHRVHIVSKLTVHNDEEERIENLMKNFFDLDAIGIEPKRPKNDPNERALTILGERSRRLPDGSFETGLLWKNDEVKLPDNKDSAMSRLKGIERKLDKNVELKRQYGEQIKHLVDSGYAEVATTPTHPEHTWYLPHFAVANPTKPKPRIVLDAAARTKGICLNDMLVTGPDLLQSLPGILMRFRQRNVAVTADIKEMFLRIRIREEDRDALRFLWREERREGSPTEYRMCRVIFGAASSPCTAIYIKNRNAEEHRKEFPEAADAIINSHYMDDYLQSFDSVQEAIHTASTVDHVHRQADFHLHKWASNEPEVLATVAPKQINQGAQVTLQDGLASERTLGLVWRPNDDKLAFNLDMKRVHPTVTDGTKRPTKREALRTIMSLFDPLGLITPVTMPAKRLLQDTWRLGVGWDHELPAELHTEWLKWLRHMQQLRHLAVARCYPHYATAMHLEMHIFVDASESACVAAVYWRAVTARATVHLSLAMAKGKVAPLKTTSIPRLELQAAVLGCRLARTVETAHDLKPVRRVFWTDSRTVLAWLRAGPRIYKPFVAHRVAEVEEETKVSEWRWVPTALNVADDATRGTPSGFDHEHRWFRGPEFLYHPEDSWPREPESREPHITGEERVTTTTRGSPRFINALPKVTRFSSWLRLIRTTGRVLQLVELFHARRTSAAGTVQQMPRQYIPLESWHLVAAEELWWKAAQEEDFDEDLRRLRKNLPLERDSKLRTLSVILDSEGIIRLKSRIDSATQIPSEQRSPPVLNGGNAYTRLYIDWIHRQNHHAGTETVVNEIRSRLWVLRLRPTARSIVKSCIKCRILRAKPASPATGDHPHTRLAHHQRPFTYVGLDYFGPYSVTVGRQHIKRYVALFTCLTTRAVHLEVAGSLSTDSAIMALRRMMARRGCPNEVYSDNGTNLRGADAELRRAAYKATEEEATSHTIRWCFIPPGAPFMGGAWERLVQSVKRALAATLSERHPTEEVLTTLLLEAEYTVNNRPLTSVSMSPEDPEALTPLHFILGGPARVPQPGSFSDADFNGKQRWRHTQRLADIFWARWVREYLPTLQQRRQPQSQGRIPQVGDVVMLVDENLPRNTWIRGQITQTYPGKDGIIRVVNIRTKNGHLKRAVKKVVVLSS